MLIKKIYKGFTRCLALPALLLGAGLSACSSQGEGLDNGGEGSGSEPAKPIYYITLKVTNEKQGMGTRGATDNSQDGDSTDLTVAGTDEETKIEDVTLFFVVEDKIVAKFEAEYVDMLDPNNNTEARIKIEDLSALKDIAGKQADLYVLANKDRLYNTANLEKGNDISKAYFNINSATEWKPLGDFGSNGLVMPLVNAAKFTIKVDEPEDTSDEAIIKVIQDLFRTDTGTIRWWNVNDDDIEGYKSAIKLERAVARVEYNDNTDDREDGKLPETPHIFPIESCDGIYVVVKGMQLFNINNSSYVFKHTSPGNDEAASLGYPNDLELLQKEKGNVEGKYNWIATPDWTYTGSVWGKSTGNFLNKFKLVNDRYAIDGDETYISIEDLWEHSESENGYHPWCYVSENTLPSIDMMADFDDDHAQLVSNYATGVMFKVLVAVNAEGTPLAYDEDGAGYPAGVYNSAKGGEMIEIMDKKGNWVEVPRDNDGNYYMNYIACIVHNNDRENYTNQSFAPMFYGVVRNNTYQMRISKIPNLPNPKDPRSLYLQIDVNVKNWQQRENHYDF